MVLFCRQAKRDDSPLVQCANRVVRSEPHTERRILPRAGDVAGNQSPHRQKSRWRIRRSLVPLQRHALCRIICMQGRAFMRRHAGHKQRGPVGEFSIKGRGIVVPSANGKGLIAGSAQDLAELRPLRINPLALRKLRHLACDQRVPRGTSGQQGGSARHQNRFIVTTDNARMGETRARGRQPIKHRGRRTSAPVAMHCVLAVVISDNQNDVRSVEFFV